MVASTSRREKPRTPGPTRTRGRPSTAPRVAPAPPSRPDPRSRRPAPTPAPPPAAIPSASTPGRWGSWCGPRRTAPAPGGVPVPPERAHQPGEPERIGVQQLDDQEPPLAPGMHVGPDDPAVGLAGQVDERLLVRGEGDRLPGHSGPRAAASRRIRESTRVHPAP